MKKIIIVLLLSAAALPAFAGFSDKDILAAELTGSVRAYKQLGITLGIGGYNHAIGISLHCNITSAFSVRASAGTDAAGVQARYMLYDENLSPFIGIGFLGADINGVRDNFKMASFGIEMINSNGTTLGLEISPLFIGDVYSSDRAPYSIDGYVGYFF